MTIVPASCARTKARQVADRRSALTLSIYRVSPPQNSIHEGWPAGLSAAEIRSTKNLLLRHQLIILRRQVKRPSLAAHARMCGASSRSPFAAK